MNMQGFVSAGSHSQNMAMDDIATILELVEAQSNIVNIRLDHIVVQNALRPLRSAVSMQTQDEPEPVSAMLEAHNVKLLLPYFISAHKTICNQAEGALRSHANKETRSSAVTYTMGLYDAANKMMTVILAASQSKLGVLFGVEYAN